MTHALLPTECDRTFYLLDDSRMETHDLLDRFIAEELFGLSNDGLIRVDVALNFLRETYRDIRDGSRAEDNRDLLDNIESLGLWLKDTVQAEDVFVSSPW